MKSETRKITLTNNFHNAEINLVVRDGTLSAAQVRRAKWELCSRYCCCSNFAGERCHDNPLWTLEEIIDPRTGANKGAIVKFN